MAETGKLMTQRQDNIIWKGLQQFAALPGWLALARNSQRVCQELTQSAPEFRTQAWELKICDVGHIRYKTDFWTALYTLTVRKPGAASDTIINLQGRIYPPGILSGNQPSVEGSLGMDGWLARLPAINLELRALEPESVLSALEALSDPQESRRLLEDSIRANSAAYRDFSIKNCTPKIVRYKPGSRCTIVYHLEYDPNLSRPHWPELVVAKTYRGEKGLNAFESMSALWNSPLGSSKLVKVAEPLAYLPEIKVLVQGPIKEEQILKDILSSAILSPSPDRLSELAALYAQDCRGSGRAP